MSPTSRLPTSSALVTRARRRRALGNLALGGLAALIVCSGLGVSFLRERVRPAALALGVEQNWGVFAPAPRDYGLRLQVVVRWSDGHRDVWKAPAGGPLVSAYRDYRWRKWAEQASAQSGRALWRPAVLYVARRLPARRGAVPVSARLVCFTLELPAPGSSRRFAWQGIELYRARLGLRPRA